jgi:hypothetical protein
MKVICELEIGNNEDFPNTKIQIEGNPFQSSGFVHLVVDGKSYEVRPTEVMEAIKRTRSDNA